MRKIVTLLVGITLTWLVLALRADDDSLEDSLSLGSDNDPSGWGRDFALPTPQVFVPKHIEAFESGKKTVAAVEAAGNKRVRFTVYPELGHGSWVEAYKDEALYRWLLQQRLPQ